MFHEDIIQVLPKLETQIPNTKKLNLFMISFHDFSYSAQHKICIHTLYHIQSRPDTRSRTQPLQEQAARTTHPHVVGAVG